MASKNFEGYSEELEPERTKFHIIVGGNLYLINFEVNKSRLRPDHETVIDKKVVPFLCRAIRALGPQKYLLTVIGSASATGPHDNNDDLAGQRAYNSAMYAIHQFEKLQKTDKTLAGASIDPVAEEVGDRIAEKEATLLHLHPGQVEKNQAHFRAAMFKFTAGTFHPGKGSVFQIREIYVFKFNKVEEPLPDVLRKIQKVISNPIAKAIIDWIKGKLLDKFYQIITAEILPGAGDVARHMVEYVVPGDVDYCFEVKDYINTTALYRFLGTEHADSYGILDAIKLLSQLKGVVGVVFKIINTAGNVGGKAQKLAKVVDAYNEAAQKFDGLIRKYTSNEIADTVKRLVDLANPYVSVWDSWTIPTSGWTPFMFHDKGPNHRVAMLNGPARRTCVASFYKTAVDLDFAGYVPNNWVDYNAEAHIISPFALHNGIFGYAQALGRMELIRGPYRDEVQVSPTQPVTN